MLEAIFTLFTTHCFAGTDGHILFTAHTWLVTYNLLCAACPITSTSKEIGPGLFCYVFSYHETGPLK